MKKLVIVSIIPLLFGFKTGNEIDQKRMNRDLEIAKNILSTLINSGSDSWFGSSTIDATYIKDYGVVFTIPEHLVYFHHTGGLIAIPDIPPIPDVDVDIDFDDDFEFSDKEISMEEFKKQKEILKENEKEIKEHQKKIQIRIKEIEEDRKALQEDIVHREMVVGDGSTSQINWEEIMITFMTDYADLIGQLRPEEKIVIKQKSPYNEMVFVWSGKNSGERKEQHVSNISAEATRKDISDFKSGKIKRDEFLKRIKIEKQEPEKKVADLEMFANIFDRFYSIDLSESFYCQDKPRYELLDGYGAVFHINATGGATVYGRARYRSSGGEYVPSKPEYKESEDEELYVKFKEDIKAFMLDYGRTIRSLNDNDKIILDIKLKSCRGCKVPKSMELSTKMSVLKQYDQQKISRDKAINQIQIKENF